MTPGDQRDILAAAKAAGVVIPVHIYLYDHYGTPHGFNLNLTSEARQLVNSLDPKLVKVVGEWLAGRATHPLLMKSRSSLSA